MRGPAQQPPATATRAAIPAVASLAVDPERLERIWAMSPAQRTAAAHDGQLTLGEMLRWAARAPARSPARQRRILLHRRAGRVDDDDAAGDRMGPRAQR